jgi:L-alanine-DL-glutamate epimerase-like enolase superfamily enzyme
VSAMSRVTLVEAYRVELPVTRSFHYASGSAGTAGSTAPVVFVRLTDDQGLTGWGEGRPSPSWSYETAETVLATLRDHLGPALLGVEVSDRWGLHERMRRTIGLGPSTGQPVAKAALDVALHDLAARAAGLPLRAFLGGSGERREVELSYTVTAHDGAAAREDAAAGRAAGFRHFNYKVAVEPCTDLEVAAAIRDEVGPGPFVWADANQGLGIAGARRLAAGLAAAGTDVLEQPFRADATHLMAQLRPATSLPLAADESSVSAGDFFRLAAAGLVDYLVVKVTRSGGLWPTMQQLAVADAAGLGILVSGLTDSMITKLAACHVAAAVGSRGPAALNGSQFLDDSQLFPGKGEIEVGGVVWLPERAGLGLEPDEDALRRLAHQTVRVGPA